MSKLLLELLALTVVLSLVFGGTTGPTPIPAPPTFTISTPSIGVCKGQVNHIPITVTNAGTGSPQGSASDFSMDSLQLAISNTRYTLPTSNSTINAGSVAPNSSEMVYIPVLIAANASPLIVAPISVNYNYGSLYADSEVRNVTLSVLGCPNQLLVKLTPKVITAVGIQNLTLNLTNTGNTTLSSLSVHMTTGSGITLLGSSTATVQSLQPHTSAYLTESAYISKNVSVSSPINVSVNYYNSSLMLQQVINSTIVLSAGEISLSPSSFSTSPSVLFQGGIFSISFILTNIGTASASAVTATAIPPKGFSGFGSSSSTFVGDVGADTQSPVSLTLVANASIKPGSYEIPIRVNYLNSLRQNVSSLINTTVIVGAQGLNGTSTYRTTRGGSSGGTAFFAFIFLIAAVVFAYLYYKERKRRHGK